MSIQRKILFSDLKSKHLNTIKSNIIICLSENFDLIGFYNELNVLTDGLIKRFLKSSQFKDQKENTCVTLLCPKGLAAHSIIILKLSKKIDLNSARVSGANLSKALGSSDGTIFYNDHIYSNEITFGFAMRDYKFENHKTSTDNKQLFLEILVENVTLSRKSYKNYNCIVEGIFFTRDLTNEPSNILTTTEFSKRITDLKCHGLKIREIDEKALKKLGMNALLGVGQGSPSPSKVLTIEWCGGDDAKPLAIVGKGVVFDTGGISLKSPAGMEQMTVDMGGAGVVVGLMKALALRKAKANVVGLVGLVENMPDGKAQRPGDVVKSMKGDTIEIINTDAEGRLVLCDLMWYAQQHYKPSGLIDLATLTGAIIVALGHEKAGVFSNNDALCNKFIKSSDIEDEGSWRMPLHENYDNLLKSNIADLKNVGGRAANAITAAQFLNRFVKEDTPWIHLDIAGVASTGSETTFAPKGASGWGVRTLNTLIQDYFEKN